MLANLYTIETVFLVRLETAFNEILALITNSNTKMELQRVVLYFGDEFILASSCVRKFAINHFIENKTNAPNITFRSIGFTFEDLRGHVQGSAHH